jgi:5-methylcytosine-specific restriction protein A
MAKITSDMIEASYEVGKKIYNKKIALQNGVDTLSKLGMNRNSAVDYIYLFDKLIQGKLYTRTSNAYATEYYINKIYNEKGNGGLENCLLSLLQHIEYYEDKASVTLKKQRSIYKKYLDLIEKKPDITIYPDDVDESVTYSEGKAKKVLVNSYERNPHARKKCIDHFGLNCQVCDFNFEKKYGELGRNFIHVHHIVDISSIGNEYSVDPIKDLVPVCPNCHAMLHKNKPAYSIDELKSILSRN